MAETRPISETKLILLIGAVQFVNVLDFMMVMPLGPDLARELGIATSKLGWIGGSYTAAAAISGLLGSLFLDRLERRTTLAFAMSGLVLGTAAGGFATGLASLMAARILAGAFGGPATSTGLAIIADAVAPERRGRAMGAVMGSFAIASVLGVPAGLELARLGGWQLPFFAVAALGALVTSLAAWQLPRTRPATGSIPPRAEARAMFQRTDVLLSWSAVALAMTANFAVIPHLSTYFQLNRGYPREHLGLLYMVGGVISFGTLRLSGWLTDRIGATRVAAIGSALYLTTLYVGFIEPLSSLPVLPIFVSFMVTGTFRMVPMQSLTSRVPRSAERASFMSIQSAVQHFASAVGASLSTSFLTQETSGALIGMDSLCLFAAALACALPFVLGLVEARVRGREAQERAGQPLQQGAS